jgi:hypothetical protein
MPLPHSLNPQNYSRGRDKAVCSFCKSLVHPAYGGGGPRPGFGLCARMCLACAFDEPVSALLEQREPINVVFAQVEEELGSAE